MIAEPRIVRHGNVEVRLHADGRVDEIVVYDAALSAACLAWAKGTKP